MYAARKRKHHEDTSRLTVIRGRSLASTVRRTNVGHRAAITTRLLLHRLHGDVDTMAGIVDPGETVTDVIILSGCLSGGRRIGALVTHHRLVLVIGVMLRMMVFHRRKTVGRRPVRRQLVLATGIESPGLAFERHQLAVSVDRRGRLAAGLIRDLSGLVSHFGYRRPGLVRRRSLRIRPVGGYCRARCIHGVLLIVLILVLVAVRVFDARSGSQILVGTGCLHADSGTSTRVVLRILRLQRLTLAPETARSPSKTALLEHVLGGRVNGPVVTLAGPAQTLRQLDEALVQAEIMAHRVLPALVGPAEEREALLQKRIDLREGQPLARTRLDRHHDQRDVRVRRFFLASRTRLPRLHLAARRIAHERLQAGLLG